jgi:hypothetical protein
MKLLFIPILLVTTNIHAAMIFGESKDFGSLSNKHQQLIKECASFRKIKNISRYVIATPPDKYSANAVLQLDAAKWNSDYGLAAVVVIDLYTDGKNRFGENIQSNNFCIFDGNDYDLRK